MAPPPKKPLHKLPIGIQSFSEIIVGSYYYVDKSAFIAQLIEQGKYYFLSRPRRFGKSLLLDSIKELFEGNQPLFAGLYIENQWDWGKTNPVIRISFGSGALRNRQELDIRIADQLAEIRRYLGVAENTSQDIPGNFRDLVISAHQKHGAQVVLLIDEYDKPILDNITDQAIATEMREGLKNLYTAIKDADEHLRFCFLTGVSKFSKVSLFSGLNNLRDITLSGEYSAICGYTDADIDRVFAPELVGLDRDLIRRWYNGYNWTGESIYNPFDVLLLLREREFKPYWFETATPTFLVELLRQRECFTPDLANLKTDFELLGKFDVDSIGTEALLFQAGYLTIHRVSQPLPGTFTYDLGYPNQEVEVSLNKALLPALGLNTGTVTRTRNTVLQALRSCDFEAVKRHCQSLFASIPHDWYRKNPIANYEGYYASVFYSHFVALGLHAEVALAATSKYPTCGQVKIPHLSGGCVELFTRFDFV